MTFNFKQKFDCPERQSFENFSDLLFDLSYRVISPLDGTGYYSLEPLSFEDRYKGDKFTVKIGGKWCENVFDCAWFHITGKRPEGCDTVIVDCGGEGLVYDRFGNEIQSITCVSSDSDRSLGEPMKRIIPVTDALLDGDYFDFWIDGAANDLFGNSRRESRFHELYAAKKNANMRDLAYDVHVLLGVLDYGEDEEFKAEIRAALNEIKYDYLTDAEALEKRKVLEPILSQKSESDFTYYAVGHAHLDLAWLWPIRESYRKGGRTFATQIMNTEMYPGYVFGASQAQLYSWVKDRYPKVYAKVKDLVAEGKWDVQGATWVEPDSNLIGPESLVRQFFYGKKFYRDEFGLDMKIFWVPDSFGYSACVPQVMKLADVPYFLTQKMSWSIYNDFPYHSFYWKGLDGSTILAHMLPENTYNSPCYAGHMTKGEKRYIERPISNKSMMLFGIGDGGAGPGFEHIERGRRFESLRSMPKVKFAKAMDFFTDFDDGVTPYPTFEGELYLERHQGAYTTRSDNKKYNRKCEFALRNYEIVAEMAKDAGFALPIAKEEIDEMWKEVLLYQFHDILPGSSINRVYEECVPRYKDMFNKLTHATQDILNSLYKKNSAVNLNSFDYDTKIKLGKTWYDVSVPAFGATEIKDKTQEFKAYSDYHTIENDKIKVQFKDGYVSSIFDKALGREFMPADSKGFVFSLYDDYGDCWDMTDCRADYINTKKDAVCIAFETDTDGAKASAKATYKIKNTEITQTYWVLDGDNTLYGKMEIEMNDTVSMLRMALPTNVATDEASFNIQFGHLKRKVTENDSWELAQFEVSGQKFVDLSEDDMGLSFINDSKYGYRCKFGVIDLDLIRSPQGGPGKNVDQGHHEVNWAVMPHAGKVGKETYKRAYFVNNPLVITEGNGGNGEGTCYESDNDNIILETIKAPEDGNGIIARFYNCSDAEQTATVGIKGYKMAEIVNIMEEKISDKADSALTLHGFELINVRFVKE